MTPGNISVVVLGSAAVLVAVAMHLLNRRAHRRNARDECAGCQQVLPSHDRYRIEGKVYCLRCAARLRVRLTAAYLTLAVLIVATGLLGVLGSIHLWRQGDPTWWLMAPVMVGSAAFLFFGGRSILRAMRDRNRFAEELERARLQAAALFDADDQHPPGA